MKTEQEFTATASFELPAGVHIWQTFADEKPWRIRATSDVDIHDAIALLRDALREIHVAIHNEGVSKS